MKTYDSRAGVRYLLCSKFVTIMQAFESENLADLVAMLKEKFEYDQDGDIRLYCESRRLP